MTNLDRLFNPKSIAVIGASNRKGSVGNSVMRNLLTIFDGIVYPVNPKRDSILGVRTYPSITKIPGNIDLVIVATPAPTVPKIVEEAGKKKAGGMVIITAGFKEAGEEGKELFQQIIDNAKRYDVRIIGPNCLGFLRPKIRLNASFASKMALPGNVAFLSQSGALCTAILDWSVQYNVGFSHFISLGSMADIGFTDMIEYLEDDPETDAIIVYMESLSNSKEFLKAAKSFTAKKPLVVLKVGRSSEGSKAAMSHTGSLTGNDAVFDAAFNRAGIIRIYNSHELYDIAQVLARQQPPKGNRLAIITNAGGPGVVATDSLIKEGGKIAQLSGSTMKKLDSFLPNHWSHGNPVDVLGDADPERYKKAVEACLKDKNVDGALVILTPQSMTKPMAIAEHLVDAGKRFKSKPILACWMGEEDVELGRRSLEKGNIPVYRVPENGIKVFMTLYRYSRDKKRLAKKERFTLSDRPKAKKKNLKIISRLKKEKRTAMTEYEAKKFVSNYGIPVAKFDFAKTAEEAAAKAFNMHFPVVMKILSPDILHKTDVGGVITGIESAKEAQEAFNKIIAKAKKHAPKAKIEGVFVEEMISKPFELLIGSKKDDLFGPTVVFGSGGVTVELMKDTNIDIAPLTKERVDKLIENTKIYSLLKGYRGMKGADIKKLKDIICNFSAMLADFPELKEVDLNPLVMDEKGGVVLDAKIILDEKVFEKNTTKKYEHLSIEPK